MHKAVPFLITVVIALVVVALVFRVPKLRTMVTGS